MSEVYEARCLCGAVKFRATGAPKWVLWCHCESCRRHSGAPASVFVAFDNTAVAMIEGEIAVFNSSPGVERGYCKKCGSTLSCANERLPNETHYYVGVFERAPELQPMGELYGDERMPWLHFAES